MDLERAAMRGCLAEAREEEARLIMMVEGYCDTIRTRLNTALTPAVDLEVPTIGVQWDALEGAWGDLQTIRLKIARLERGLH